MLSTIIAHIRTLVTIQMVAIELQGFRHLREEQRIPIIFDQGLPNGAGGYDDVGTDLADIGYDLIYTGMTKTGTLWAYGMAGTIPAASDDRLGKDLWAVGPEVMLGKFLEQRF